MARCSTRRWKKLWLWLHFFPAGAMSYMHTHTTFAVLPCCSAIQGRQCSKLQDCVLQEKSLTCIRPFKVGSTSSLAEQGHAAQPPAPRQKIDAPKKASPQHTTLASPWMAKFWFTIARSQEWQNSCLLSQGAKYFDATLAPWQALNGKIQGYYDEQTELLLTFVP